MPTLNVCQKMPDIRESVPLILALFTYVLKKVKPPTISENCPLVVAGQVALDVDAQLVLKAFADALAEHAALEQIVHQRVVHLVLEELPEQDEVAALGPVAAHLAYVVDLVVVEAHVEVGFLREARRSGCCAGSG